MRGNLSNTLQRYDFSPVLRPIQNGELADSARLRQEVAHLVHQVNRGLAILDADVDVQAEDQVRARHQLHVFDDLQVALVGIDVLGAPVGKRMRGAGTQQQAVLLASFTMARRKLMMSARASLLRQTRCRLRPPTGASRP